MLSGRDGADQGRSDSPIARIRTGEKRYGQKNHTAFHDLGQNRDMMNYKYDVENRSDGNERTEKNPGLWN